MTCTYPNCGQPHQARGWCSTHYGQWRRGKPLQPRRPPRSADSLVEDFDWLLTHGETPATALRRIGVSGRQMQRAYATLKQPAPPGLARAADYRLADQ